MKIRFNPPAVLLVFLCACVSAPPALSQQVSPQMFAGLRWRLIGPFRGGRSVAACGVPGDSKTFYFGAVDGGIWKTTDAGLIWQPVFDGQSVASIGAIAVAPSDPQVVYAGTGESDIRSDLASGDGVYKSSDAGKTWHNIGLKDSRQISRIVIDPTNANVVMVGALGHAYGPNQERGVYKSTDGGLTWKHVLDKGPEVGVADLAIASANPKVLLATTWNARRPAWSTYGPANGPGGALYRSLDGGDTWTELAGNGLPSGNWGRSGVAIAPDGKRMYALIEASAGGLYRSDDGGDHWVLANDDDRLTARAWYFTSITIDPSNPDRVYAPNIALYQLDHAGTTVTVSRGAPGGDDYHQLWIDPSDVSRMILAADQGTTITLDGGATWSSWYNQPTAQFYHVITDNKFPYTVYGAQQDSGSAGILSRTDHFQITARDWITTSGGEGGYFAPDPNDPNILYDTDAYGAVERFDLRTNLSQNIAPWPVIPLASSPSSTPWSSVAGASIADRKYRAPWTPMLIFSPVDKKTLYLGTQYIMTTTDGGLHWQRISPDLTGAVQQKAKPTVPASVVNARELGYGVIYAIAPSPLKQDEIWAGSDTGLIHLTQNGGKTWENVTPAGLASWSKLSMMEASHFDPGEAWSAVDRHQLDDQTPIIYRTKNFGATWQRIDQGIPPNSFLRAIREDPQKKGLLFAGTEFGVYVSFNDGDNWQPLQLNLPVTSVRDLQVHGDDLVIATHGRSFWILDDIQPLREISATKSCTPACLFHPADAMRIDNNSYIGTPLPPEEPAADNPPDGAILDYALSAPATEVTLTISDSAQRIVRRFSSSDEEAGKRPPLAIAERWFPKAPRLEAAPGMHRFVWDLRWRNSGDKDVDEDEETLIAPSGPRVPPGSYSVTLTADGKSFTTTLIVRMDPRSSAGATVLSEQYRLGKSIFEETLMARGALAEIDSFSSHLAQLKPDRLDKVPGLAVMAETLKHSISIILEGNTNSPSDIHGMSAANAGIDAVLNAVEGGDRETPAAVLALYQQSKDEAEKQRTAWSETKANMLPKLNALLRQAALGPISMSEIEEEVQELKAR